MATILDLFKSRQEELYGKVDNIRINSRGLINPPRGAALLASSPNAVADLIGGQVAGVIKGVANRPSDTIFKSNMPFAKPISLGATQAALRDRIEADTDYFIKQSPSPASVIARIKQGGSSPQGVATNLAIQGLNKFGSKKGLQNLKNSLKKKLDSDGYGTKYQSVDLGKKPLKLTKKFSKYKPVYGEVPSEVIEGSVWKQISLADRNNAADWNTANSTVFTTEKYSTYQEYTNEIDKYKDAGIVWVNFKKYGTNEVIPFAGTVSGINEDVSPEWNTFKYVGSPFNVYRYGGVERTINFDLKLYYTTIKEKDVMIKKINFLKSLAFPYDEVSSIKYKDVETALAFSPNLVYFGIDGLYKNVLGYIETLSFSIDDTTAWSNLNPNMEDGGDITSYPNIINVSIGMKIIENHKNEVKSGITRYKYNFDGYNDDSKYEIELTKEKNTDNNTTT